MHLPATKHDPMGGSMTCAWPWSRPVLAALVLLSASLPGVARPRPCPPSPQTITRMTPEVWLIAGQAGSQQDQGRDERPTPGPGACHGSPHRVVFRIRQMHSGWPCASVSS